MTDSSSPAGTACVAGGGVIGAGWAARFLLHGWDVKVYDPHPDAAGRMQQVLDNARISTPALADLPMPAEGSMTFCASLAEAAASASWIQESVPEELPLKHKTLAEIDAEIDLMRAEWERVERQRRA